jgi:putative ABC transport system permease protein
MSVVGLTDRTASWMTPLTFVTRDTANRLQRRGDSANFFLLRSDGGDGDQLAREIDARFPELNAMTSEEIGENSRRLLADNFNAPLLIMVVISLGIGALVIGLSVYGFVSERRREYGALKAVGTRNRGLYRLVTTQALALAAVGLVSGVLLTRLAAWGIHAAWPKFLFVSLPSHYALLIVAALAMALVGALAPARVLARLDPAEVFRR